MANIKKIISNADKLPPEERQKVLLDVIESSKAKFMSLILDKADTDVLKSALLEKAKSFMSSSKSSEVWDAMDIIEALGGDERTEIFSQTITHNSKNVRLHTLAKVENLDESDALKIAIKALKDDATTVKIKAADILGNLGDKKAVEPLIALLRSGFIVSSSAAEALGKLKDKRAAEPLFRAYRYHKDADNHTVCKDIIDAISEIGAVEDNIDKVGGYLNNKVIPEYGNIMVALAKTGDSRAIPYIVDAQRPIYAFDTFKLKVYCLAQINDISAAHQIISWSTASIPQSWDLSQVRSTAVNALLKFPQDMVLQLFYDYTQQYCGFSEVDLYEAYAYNITDRDAIPIMYNMIDEKRVKLSCVTIQALARLKYEPSIPILEKWTQSSKNKISNAAKKAIISITE